MYLLPFFKVLSLEFVNICTLFFMKRLFHFKLEMRSVVRGICFIAKSTMNELLQ